MKILGFETTDTIASVSLYLDGKISLKTINEKLRHAESVLPYAELLLSENQLKTSDMDAFAVDVGPGSFTGVRIGVCLANALAMAHNKPVISVNALEALAQHVMNDDSHNIAAIIDARNGNGYAALYKGDQTLIEPQACLIDDFLKIIPSESVLTGTACSDQRYPSAEDIVKIASKRIGHKNVSPLYLKPSQAERMYKQ